MKPLRNIAIAAALAAGTLPAAAAEFSALQVDKSALTFTVRQMGVPVDGRFGRFTSQLAFDPAKPAAAKAAIEIQIGSIDTGSKEANEEAVGKSWFDVKNYPTARFVATGVRALGGNRFEVAGQLTMKGRTKEIAAPFTFQPQGANGDVAVFDGGFTIRRADFAIGDGPWADFDTVANEIQIKFRFVVAAKK